MGRKLGANAMGPPPPGRSDSAELGACTPGSDGPPQDQRKGCRRRPQVVKLLSVDSLPAICPWNRFNLSGPTAEMQAVAVLAVEAANFENQ